MHQLNGPYEIEMEFDEDYSERNIDGARMVTKFKWESNFDGTYRLSIDNKLTIDERAKKTVHIQLPIKYKYSHNIDWFGFKIDDLFVIGYGMDYEYKFRGLSSIYYMLDN